MRVVVGLFVLGATAFAASDDAHALLAKARAAFLQNRGRERYWNWTTTTTRTVTGKRGAVLDEVPSVTVESPIRSDGKRCNALLAWGDGREPYLANADADARCTVEQETPEAFREEVLLESKWVRIQARSATAITLRIARDPDAAASSDRALRCAGSLQGTVQLDPVTFYPRVLDLEVVASGCEQRFEVVNHYDDQPVSAAVSTLRKGARLRREYVLEKDKGGNAEKNFWICVRAHSVRPLRDNAQVLIVWGRRVELQTSVKDRRIVVNATTTAHELATESVVKFATEPK